MGPWFVASALDCGTGLVLIVCLALRRAGYLSLEQKHVINLAKMLAVFVLVDLYFYACDLLTSGYFGGEGAEVVTMLTSGALAPAFWTQIILMAVSVAILVVPKLRTDAGVVAASALAIVGVFCKRLQILVGGFQIPNLDMPGVTTQYTITNWQAGFSGAYQGMVYAPQPIELGVTAGVLAMCVLFLLLGLKYLPLKPAGDK